MLTIYRSNRAELLAQLLATQLRLTPPDPFEQVQVMVNTWPTSRWLGEQLASHLGGIVANVRFPFPGGRLRQLVDLVMAATESDDPDHNPAPYPAGHPTFSDPDPWRAQQLVWPLLDLLPQIAGSLEGEPLRRWLVDRDLSRNLEIASWRLGRAIADSFDDYALYRPDLLRAWEEGLPGDPGRPALPATQSWQPLLYRALRERLIGLPFGLRVEEAIRRLQRRPPDTPLPGLPTSSPIRLFGLSSMAPVQVQLLQALSGSADVELFLLTPCRDLWERCARRRDQLSAARALACPLEADWLLEAPALEARFGRLGAEFHQLLEGTGETQLGSWEERDLFFAPASAASSPVAPLLAQLQEHLADPHLAPQLKLQPGDHSLEFHPCPGPLRQVQILRDRLLQLMANDPSLEPRHILVMTPQVDRFAPLVTSVFSDTTATGVELPWRLTDRSQQSDAGIGRTLLSLLELAGGRLTASGLEALLESIPLQQRFGLRQEEAADLSGALQRCGFRWGLDGPERDGDPTHSLSWAIDRLLLGLVLPVTPGLSPGDAAPWPLPVSLELAGRWLHLLTRLRHWLTELRHGCTCKAWDVRLRLLLDDLFLQSGDTAWEWPPLLAAIDDWQRASKDCKQQLEAAVVAAVLEERLSADSGRFGHRSGALTIGALEPMRAIPYRVIVLMGLDADAFPRQSQRPGFHLMEMDRRLGDPSPADQDRYVLLEALLSARDHLLISWSCRDDRTGVDLEPASPVRQWQQWLEAQLGEGAKVLTIPHAASALDRANFRPQAERPPASCDRRLLDTRRLLDDTTAARPLALAAQAMPDHLPDVVATTQPAEDLRDWLMRPQVRWLRQLGLRPREREEGIDDLEALELDERDRSALLRQRISDSALAPSVYGPTDRDAPENQDHDADQEPAAPDPDVWLERCRGQGRLPAAAAGVMEARLLEERWVSLNASLRELGPASQEPLAWKDWRATPLFRGDVVVLIHGGTEQAPQRMDLWLQLLLAAAIPNGPSPRQGVLLARDRNQFKPMLRLAAPDAEIARQELDRLVALRHQWMLSCWPVPPRTGLAFLRAERKQPGTGLAKATAIWEGGPMQWAERDQEEMRLCFGADRSAKTLVEGPFAACVAELYGPLVEAEI